MPVRVRAKWDVERVVGLAAQVSAEFVRGFRRGVASGPVEASGKALGSAAFEYGEGHFFRHVTDARHLVSCVFKGQE